MSNAIGQVKCTACDGNADVKQGTTGTLTIVCKVPTCRAQTFVKSPTQVAALLKRLAPQPAPGAQPGGNQAPAAAAKKLDPITGGL